MGWFGLLHLLVPHRIINQCNGKSSLQVLSTGVISEILMGFIHEKINVLHVIQIFWMGTKGYSGYISPMKGPDLGDLFRPK